MGAGNMTTQLLDSASQIGSRPRLRWSTCSLRADRRFIRLAAGGPRVSWHSSIQITRRLSAFAPRTAEMGIAWSKVASLPACWVAKASRYRSVSCREP